MPLVLKCTKRLYTADLIGVGASVNTTAAGIFAGASQPVIGFAMLAVSRCGNRCDTRRNRYPAMPVTGC